MCCRSTVEQVGGPDSAASLPDYQSPHHVGAPADINDKRTFYVTLFVLLHVSSFVMVLLCFRFRSLPKLVSQVQHINLHTDSLLHCIQYLL